MTDPTRPVQWTLGGQPATCATCLYFKRYEGRYRENLYCARPGRLSLTVASPDVVCGHWRPAVETLPLEQKDEEVP